MKKQLCLLSLSLLTSQALIAEMQDAPAAAPIETKQSSCATDCCKPCCVPEPKKCIDCECYVPAWYDLQCDWGLFFTLDFLYWYGKECNLPYAYTSVLQNGFLSENFAGSRIAYPASLESLKTKWDPGVRVGLGWNLCEGWDLYFTWTGYWNKQTGSSTVADFANVPVENGVATLQGIWSYPRAQVDMPTNQYGKVTATWDFKMNRFALEMGKRVWPTRYFTLRPFAGLGGIWTETDFDVTHTAPESLPRLGTATTDQNNRNWGVGLVGGIEPTFQFMDCFALYGSVGMALFWGNQKYAIKASNVQMAEDPGVGEDFFLDYSFSGGESIYCMLPILDMGIGLRFETFWCERRYHFAFDLGWEHHTLFHYNLRRSVPDLSANGVSATLYPSNITFFPNDVSMGGLVIRVRFDF